MCVGSHTSPTVTLLTLARNKVHNICALASYFLGAPLHADAAAVQVLSGGGSESSRVASNAQPVTWRGEGVNAGLCALR